MKVIKWLFQLIKRIFNMIGLAKVSTVVEKRDVNAEKSGGVIEGETKQAKTAIVADSIFNDSKLKPNEKIYLIILIRAYDATLGYSEISNKSIMKAASCTNNGTIIEVINRLEKKKYIKRIEDKKGKIGKYRILNHIEFCDEGDVISDGLFSSKRLDTECEDSKSNSGKSIKGDVNGQGECKDIKLLKKIQNEIRTSNEVLSDLIDKANSIDVEIDIELMKNGKIE